MTGQDDHLRVRWVMKEGRRVFTDVDDGSRFDDLELLLERRALKQEARKKQQKQQKQQRQA